MQINHNIRAMITQHALYQNNNAMGKSLEKLSTGLRINRAQDDAAGLAMSEQMRSQIRGLGKARQNSQDGICALQIAEGALAEITNMMQRQKELAVQAANDTLTSTERVYLDDEFQALTKEMDRIAKSTDYNGKNVLIFDPNPNLSFGATKLNPYSMEVSFMDSAKTLYNNFGAKLTGGFGMVGGIGLTSPDVLTAELGLVGPQAAYNSARIDLEIAKAELAATDPTDTAAMTAAQTAMTAAQTAYTTALTNFNVAKDNVQVAWNADIAPELEVVNDAISGVNKVISDLNGIGLSEGNIKEVLQAILDAGDIATNNADYTFGGDMVYADVLNVFTSDVISVNLSASDKQTIKDFNAFLRDVRDALDLYTASEIGDPKYGDENDILQAAMDAMASSLWKLKSSDNESIVFNDNIQEMTISVASTNYSMLAKAVNSVATMLNNVSVTYSNIMVAGTLVSYASIGTNDVANLGGIFSMAASPQIKDAVATIMQFDISKMRDANGPLPFDAADMQIALAIQKAVSELQEHYNHYTNELSYPVGTAASDILHVTPNYSHSLGGKDASEITVNYVEINVKGLGMESQCITEQAHATRAIDRIDEVVKVVSGNRAAIGTYINRLEYTINNIASMTYNTQEAESRIRDTDFSKETTDFTRNQIMVQSATSILAQANSLPQMVLGLLG